MNVSSYQSQRGAATLIITVVLLALLTVTVLVVSQNVTVDLRSSSNANRDKEALEVAQGGVEYGAMRYLADNTKTSGSVAVPSTGGVVSDYLVTNTSGTLTVVASGSSGDGTALRQVWEDYDIFSIAKIGELPPLMAGGKFPPNGTFSIIANPNGGGSGNKVSAWVKSAENSDGGSWQTCQLSEYLASGTNIVYSEIDGYPICSDCQCKLSEPKLCDGTLVDDATDCPDMVIETGCMPDVFENLFTTVDLIDDCGSSSGTYTTVDPIKREALPLDDCGDLNASSGLNTNFRGLSLYWYDGDSDCDISGTVGSYENPVLLVTESDFKISANTAEFFGIVMVLDNCYDGTGNPCSSGSDAPKVQTTGGKIYGSLLASKDVELPAGNISLIWAPNVTKALTNNGKGWPGLGRIGGTWRDYE